MSLFYSEKYVSVDRSKPMEIGKRYDFGFRVHNPRRLSEISLKAVFEAIGNHFDYIIGYSPVTFPNEEPGILTYFVKVKRKITPTQVFQEVTSYADEKGWIKLEPQNVRTWVKSFRWWIPVVSLAVAGAIAVKKKKKEG